MGSWLPSEATASLAKSGGSPDSIEFGSFPFPAVGDNRGEGLVQAQPIGFVIPAKARKAAAAKQFMAWFTHKDRMARIASEAKNLTPRTDIEAPSELASGTARAAQRQRDRPARQSTHQRPHRLSLL